MTFCDDTFTASLGRHQSLWRQLAETFAGNLAASFDYRIVLAETFVHVPVVSDLFDFRVFGPWIGRDEVWLLSHFYAQADTPY